MYVLPWYFGVGGNLFLWCGVECSDNPVVVCWCILWQIYFKSDGRMGCRVPVPVQAFLQELLVRSPLALSLDQLRSGYS